VRNGHVVVRRVYLTEEMAGYDDWCCPPRSFVIRDEDRPTLEGRRS
jgi:hypothetical protein